MADRTGGPGGGGRPAPELPVHGTGPGEITIEGLTAGGWALLVFVSEHCPTSALALRRLGPLCQAWATAGLTAIAIFEDPLEVAIRTARRLGWTGRVATDDPPYPASRAYRVATVPTAVLAGRGGVLAGTVAGWDHPALAALLGAAEEMLGSGLAVPPPPSRCASRAAPPKPPSTRTWRRRCPATAPPTSWRRCSSAAGPTACR